MNNEKNHNYDEFSTYYFNTQKDILLRIESQFYRASHCLVFLSKILHNYANTAHTQGYPYHCTHIKWFKEIIRTKRIRLSPFECMRNDKTEGQFILESFNRACDTLYNNGVINSDEKKQLLDIELNNRHYIYRTDKTRERIECTPYVICFTTLFPPTYYMWARYTKDEKSNFDDGVCFSFPLAEMDYPIYGNYRPMNSTCYGVFDFYRVIYDDELVEKMFKMSITFMKEIELDFKYIIDNVSILLNEARLFVKNPEFKDEYEVRMVAYIPNDKYYNEDIWKHISIEENDGKKYAYVNIDEILVSMGICISPHSSMTDVEIVSFLNENGIKTAFPPIKCNQHNNEIVVGINHKE